MPEALLVVAAAEKAFHLSEAPKLKPCKLSKSRFSKIDGRNAAVKVGRASAAAALAATDEDGVGSAAASVGATGATAQAAGGKRTRKQQLQDTCLANSIVYTGLSVAAMTAALLLAGVRSVVPASQSAHGRRALAQVPVPSTTPQVTTARVMLVTAPVSPKLTLTSLRATTTALFTQMTSTARRRTTRMTMGPVVTVRASRTSSTLLRRRQPRTCGRTTRACSWRTSK